MSAVHTEPAKTVTTPTVPVQPGPRPAFRLPTVEHQPPSTGRVFGLTFWAAIAIFIGFIPAGRLVVGLAFQTSTFWWYPSAAATIGLLGLALITSAFASIHRAHLPWALMTIATLLLAVNVAMVYTIPWASRT